MPANLDGAHPARTRVAWLTSDYPWEESPYIGIFHRTSARALVRAAVDVTVVSPTPAAPWPLRALHERWAQHARAPRHQVDEGVTITRPRYLAIPGEPDWARPEIAIALAARRARREWISAQLLHAHYAAPFGMAAWHLARWTGRPYVVTLHGDDVTSWPASHPHAMSRYRRALKGASAVVSVSHAIASDVRRIADVESTVIPIGVDIGRFADVGVTREEARARLGLPADRFIVLVVAVLEPRKGIRPFVDALISLGPPFLGVLVGDGPEAGYRATDPAAQGVIDYRGPYPNTAIPEFLAAADVLVLASHREGLPTILVEGGAAGTPIIASQAGGTPELLADDRGVLLPEVSSAAIVSAVRAVAADIGAAASRAERLRQYVRAEYDVDRCAARLARLYADLVAARPGSSTRP